MGLSQPIGSGSLSRSPRCSGNSLCRCRSLTQIPTRLMIFSDRLSLILSLSPSFSPFSPLVLLFLPLTYFFSSSTSRFLAFSLFFPLCVHNDCDPERTVMFNLTIWVFIVFLVGGNCLTVLNSFLQVLPLTHPEDVRKHNSSIHITTPTGFPAVCAPGGWG